MNTNGLAKHYECLNPRERLSLILDAAARGDEQERKRLVQSAPRLAYAVQHHAGLAHALLGVSTAHFIDLLDLVARYGVLLGAAVFWKGRDAKRARDRALWYGHLIKVKLAGWRQFCGENQFHPEVFWSRFPGFDTIKLAEGIVEEASYSAEEARRFAQRSGWDPDVLPTAEAVAADLRDALRAGLEWWT